MGGLLRLSRGIDAMNAAVGRTAAWAIVVAILVSAVNAIVRKVFGVSSNAWLELQWYLFGAVFMLCAPWTLAANEHIRIDILSSRLTQRGRNVVELFGQFVFLLPFALVMVYLSIPYVRLSVLSGEVSSSAGGLIIWPAKLLILAGFVLLLVQWLSEVIKRVAIAQGRLADSHQVGHTAAAEAEAERLLAQAEIDPAVEMPAAARG